MLDSTNNQVSPLTNKHVLFSDLFRTIKNKRVLSEGKAERVYTANLLYESEDNPCFQGQANIHWRIKLRSNDAVWQKHTGFGIDVINCYHPANYLETIRSCFSRQIGSGITNTGRYPINVLALIKQAGAAMAHYCLTGTLNADIIAAKRAKYTDVTVIANADGLSVLSEHTLYLPNTLRAQDIGIYNVVYLLGCACSCDIALDNVLVINGVQKFTVREGSVAMWAHDLHNTIFYLLGLMDAAGAGDIASLALTAGLHQVYTIVGHSDEGAIMRDVLRELSFVPSYGIIPPINTTHFSHTNVLLSKSPSWDALSAVWDYTAVATAALVHLSDPTMCVSGDIYPTILSAKDTINACNEQLLSALVDSGPSFFEIYMQNLSTFFAVDNNRAHGAEQGLLTALINVVHDRRTQNHLSIGDVLAPWYWVESSGIFSDVTMFQSPITASGLGPQALHGSVLSLPAMEQHNFVQSQGIYDIYKVAWTSIRRSPIFTLLNNRLGDGIANIDFLANTNENFILEGQPTRRTCTCDGHGTVNAKCDHKQPNRGSLDEYLWGRVSCHIFHPAELSSFSDVLLRVRAWVVDKDGDVFTTNMPTQRVMSGRINVYLQGVRLSETTEHLLKLPEVNRKYVRAAKHLTLMRTLDSNGLVDFIFSGLRVGEARKLYKPNPSFQKNSEKVINVSQTIEPTFEVSQSRSGQSYRTNISVMKSDTVKTGSIEGIEFRGRETVPDVDAQPTVPISDDNTTET
uniref:Putative coat protein n=1 Tax=Blechomonas maslovi Leishmaniavirus-like RNA virus 1 TaxID=2364204 RepID=A0A386ISB4_9VIRU|nr:putative coat protein [Blechomonas maslovi Leishmaniavirus-like RNA virus 1]